MRSARRIGESDIYHVVSRGVGGQIIFETDSDRRKYLSSLRFHIDDAGGSVLGWCLMDNHAHILAHARMDRLSDAMRRLNSGYALYFNTKYERFGHLFQGRFWSEPVDDDEYLMTVLRYIHLNPVKAGITYGCEYKWSSFNHYIHGELSNEEKRIISIYGGTDAFYSFHNPENILGKATASEAEVSVALAGQSPPSLENALIIAQKKFGISGLENIKSLGRNERDKALTTLKKCGLSVNQIQKITGISHGTIARVTGMQ